MARKQMRRPGSRRSPAGATPSWARYTRARRAFTCCSTSSAWPSRPAKNPSTIRLRRAFVGIDLVRALIRDATTFSLARAAGDTARSAARIPFMSNISGRFQGA